MILDLGYTILMVLLRRQVGRQMEGKYNLGTPEAAESGMILHTVDSIL